MPTPPLLQMDDEQMEEVDNLIKELRREESKDELKGSDRVFQLAAALIIHPKKENIEEGLQLMEVLAFQQWSSTQHKIERSEQIKEQDINDTRCYYYYISIAQVKLGELVKARSTVQRILDMAPQDVQAVELAQYIDDKLLNSAMKGAAMVAAGIVGAVAFLKFVRR